VRVLGSEPGRHGAGVGASDGDPLGLAGYSFEFVLIDVLDEVGEVAEALLGREEAEVVLGH
jgi:hypothetical protein